jgi:Outer membrane receptor proteins, mostly Fe transport
MFTRMSHVTCAAVALWSLIPCSGAHAQQSTVLESVTVWAQKRAANLQNVPLSVAALSADDLSTAGLSKVEDVADRVPALDLQSSVSATTTSLRIRRVGSLGNIPTFEPAVGLFVDGVFRSRSLLATGDFVDLERIEILSGPQNTLYGKNTSAGVVALYTQPPPGHFEGSAEATSGWLDMADSPSLTQFKLRLGGPLTSTLRASVGAVRSSHGNTMSNALAGGPNGNDEDRLALRGQLSWSPSDDLELRLLAGYAREDDTSGDSDVYLAPGAPSTTVAGILQQGFPSECSDDVPRNRTTCAVAMPTLDFEAVDLSLLGTYHLANGWTLTSVTGWDRYEALRDNEDVSQLRTPLLFFADSEKGSSIQQELRLASTAGIASWLAGVFYYRNDYERGMHGERPMFGPNGAAAFDPIWSVLLRGIPLALPGQLGIHDSHLDTRYVSAFGDVVWKLGERLSLATGLRWQREEKDAAINNSVTIPGASLVSTTLTPTVSPSGEPVNGTLSRRSENVTWSITPQYRFSDGFMGYLTLARGAKSGGFNTGFGNLPLAAREFADERIRHYELGMRGTHAGGRSRFSAAAFYTEYRDYQDAAFVSAQFSVGNADLAVLRGVEAEGAVVFVPGITADFAISLADFAYATNTTGACSPGRIPDGTAPRSCNLSGEHPIDAPVWSTHLGLLYEHDVSWAELYARIDWSWTDQYNTSFSADPRLVQNDYSDVALRIGGRIGSRYEIVLWGENLLDEDVTVIDAVLNLFNDASYHSFMAQPRRYGATVRVRF